MTGTEWHGKIVLVTGGVGGIGRATATAFRNAGAKVVVADVNAPSDGICDLAMTIDVSKPTDCERMISETLNTFGRLDLLINAAGVWTEGPAAEATEEEWDRVIDINLKGTFFACRYAVPALEESEGQIVNIASDAGLMGNAGAAIYCASKGGVVLLTKALALELAPKCVRVNAICPCDVETPMLSYQAETFGGGDPLGYLAKLRSIYPQGQRARFAMPEEIAAFILAIASPALKPLTGAALPIDFGTTAGR
jgi:NAD(P)-dependent dehydrogenase (short-subunit alcohol dehydrogenase family)